MFEMMPIDPKTSPKRVKLPELVPIDPSGEAWEAELAEMWFVMMSTMVPIDPKGEAAVVAAARAAKAGPGHRSFAMDALESSERLAVMQNVAEVTVASTSV